ncbi:MAG TPA: glycosyltransferase family 2 protein [Patescibacteria group bacterium]|nr:glycosyltransferase family 2 protein [Patescibacteria group bacterium]
MINLSAIVLTKNEENMIADCLDSLSFCDEVVVIDSKSTDRTAEIAERAGAKVFKDISSSFAERRNLGKSKAKGKWLLYIDADERVSPQLQQSIKSIVDAQREVFSAYRIQRQNYYLGNHLWPYIEKLERLFKKEALDHWYGQLHETAKVKGEIGELEGYILHFSHRDLESMVEKTNLWSETEANLRLNANHPAMTWWRFPRVMLSAFYASYVQQKGYKAGTAGLIESIYQSFSIFITYAKLWEKQNEQK